MEEQSPLTGEASNTKFATVKIGFLIAQYLNKTGRDIPARVLFHECMEVAKSFLLGDGSDELKGHVYIYMGVVCHTLYYVKQAVEYTEMSVAIQVALPKLFPEELTWNSYRVLGDSYHKGRNYRKAIESYEKALDYAKNGTQKTRIYQDLRALYLEVGNIRKATDYVQKCKDLLKEEAASREIEQACLHGQGDIFLANGHLGKAKMQLEQALAISREIKDKLGECEASGLLAKAYTQLNDLQNALKYNKLALSLAKELGRKDLQFERCIDVCSIYTSLRDCDKATEYLDQVPAIAGQFENIPDKVIYFFHRGLIHETKDEVKEAITAYEQSSKYYEETAVFIEKKDGYKATANHKYHRVYRHLCKVLITDKQQTKALIMADRGRTRALADFIESNFQTPNEPQRKILSLDEIKEIAAMSPGSTILVMTIGINKMYFWVIKPDGSITFRELAAESAKVNALERIKPMLERICDDIDVREFEVRCEDRSLPDIDEDDDWYSSSAYRRKKRESFKTPIISCFTDLYNLIIAPVADILFGSSGEHIPEEVVFVPDGPLWTTPFAALQAADGTHLCDLLRIRVFPSLTTFNHIRSSPAGYHSDTGILIAGDPKVGDLHYKGDVCHIVRLPAAKKELHLIGELLKVPTLTGKSATKEEVLRRMASVSLLHLAIHDCQYREEIALAPSPSTGFVNLEKKDYLLTMHEVLNAKLKAKLVVLSTYYSGRGAIRPEGAIRVARAFLGSGVRSVLMQLWPMNGEAKTYFMKYFYQQLLQGERASVALQVATRELKKLRVSKARHFGAFLLIGDDVKISFKA